MIIDQTRSSSLKKTVGEMLFVEENKRVRYLSLLCVKMILASLSSKYKE